MNQEFYKSDEQGNQVAEETLLKTRDGLPEVIAKTHKECHQSEAKGARNDAGDALLPVVHPKPSYFWLCMSQSLR